MVATAMERTGTSTALTAMGVMVTGALRCGL